MPSEGLPSHYAFIINPRAGRRTSKNLISQINGIFQRQDGRTWEILLTDHQGHAREMAADIAHRYGGDALIFACGGDGTLHEVVNGAFGTSAIVGLLPIGTANDFAKTALSRNEPDWLLEHVFQPDIRSIDVMSVDGRICLNITSFGFDTKVKRQASAITAKAHWLGSLTYSLAVLISLFGNREYPMHYELTTIDSAGRLDEISGDARFILAAICNGRFYGGGFQPAPKALLDDGRLDFSIVDCLPMRKILPLIPKYKKGTHMPNPSIHFWQVTKGRIEAPAGMLLGNYDGEDFEAPAIDFAVLPGALRFAFY